MSRKIKTYEDNTDLPDKLRMAEKVRSTLNLTIRDVGEIMDIDHSTYARWLDQSRHPTDENMHKIEQFIIDAIK